MFEALEDYLRCGRNAPKGPARTFEPRPPPVGLPPVADLVARAAVTVALPAAGRDEGVVEPVAGAAEVGVEPAAGAGQVRERSAPEVEEKTAAVKRRRFAYDVDARAALGQEAAAFHREYTAAHGHPRGVWVAFVQHLSEIGANVGQGGGVPSLNEIRQAYRIEAKRSQDEQPTHRLPGRRRRIGGGRTTESNQLEEELWHWFVDTLSSAPIRINTGMVMAQAEALKADLLEFHHLSVEKGKAEALRPPKVAHINSMWVTRWKRKYKVSFRAVNLRYKVSAAKRDARMRILWSNVIRLRTLHAALFGKGKLRFVGLDQKPLWFNSSHDSKTLAVKGSRRVAVKENTAASRERFTVLTNCLSWKPTVATWPPAAVAGDPAAGGGPEPLAGAGVDGPASAGAQAAGAAGVGVARAAPGHGGAVPSMAVLFRAGSSGTGTTMRKRLSCPENTLLQFAPKGSYRLANMLDFLRWAFRPAPQPSDSLVVVLDWYAVHLDGEIDNLLHDMGHAVLRIGGGITGDVQVGDTHRHGPYTKLYRELEQEDAHRQQRIRPGRMPETSRQTVLTRAARAWASLDHSKGEKEWKEDGFLNALDGTEDGALRRDLQPMWARLGMPEARARIVQEVRDMVSSGRLSQWSQYPTILEAYDEHRPMREGEEAAVPLIGDDEDDAASDAEAPDAIEAEEGDTQDAAAAGSSDGAPPGEVPATPATGFLPPALERRARQDLAKAASGRRLAALSDAAALLRGVDNDAADTLVTRMLNLERTLRLTKPSQIWLRARALQRKDEDTVARAAVEAADLERERLKLALKRAKADEIALRSKTIAERESAKALAATARAMLNRARLEGDRQRQREEVLRVHFVDYKLCQAKAWFQDATSGAARRDRCAQILRRARASIGQIPPTPGPWSPKDRGGYIDITPMHLLSLTSKPKRAEMEFASEALARRLYGGRHPSEAVSAKSPVQRARDMLEECLPGFQAHFPAFMLLSSTLRQHHGNLDIALFEVLWRFSHGLGDAWPHGLLAWPLSPADMAAFLRAQGREDLLEETPLPPEAPSGPSSSSSSSANAPKPAKVASGACSSSLAAAKPPSPAKAARGASSSSSGAAKPLISPAAAAAAAFAAAMASPAPAKAPPPKAPSGPVAKTGLAAKWTEGPP